MKKTAPSIVVFVGYWIALLWFCTMIFGQDLFSLPNNRGFLIFIGCFALLWVDHCMIHSDKLPLILFVPIALYLGSFLYRGIFTDLHYLPLFLGKSILVSAIMILISSIPFSDIWKITNNELRKNIFKKWLGRMAKSSVLPIILALLILIVHYVDEWIRNVPENLPAILSLFLSLFGIILALFITIAPYISMAAVWFIAKHFYTEALEEIHSSFASDFWQLAETKYGVSPAVCKVGSKGFISYNVKEAADHPERTYFYTDGHTQLTFGKAPMVQVPNDKRLNQIQSIVLSITDVAGISRQTMLENYKSGYGFLTKWKNESDSASAVNHMLDSPGMHQFKGTIPVQSVANFFFQRQNEIDAIIDAQMRYYHSDYKGMMIGLSGEREIQKVLSMHEDAFYVIYDLRLEFPVHDGEVTSVEIDAFVIAPNGLYAIEVKNYGAEGKYRIAIDRDGSWFKEKTGRNGKVNRDPMSNPFGQNDRQTAYLERMVNRILGRDMDDRIPVHGIVVIANDEVELSIAPNAPQAPIRIAALYNQISKNQQRILSKEEVDRLYTELSRKNLPPKGYPLYDYSKEIISLLKESQELKEMADDTSLKLAKCLQENPQYAKEVGSKRLFSLKKLSSLNK